MDKIILQFIWNGKGTRIAKTNMTNRNKLVIINLLDFNTYTVLVNKTTWYWWRKRHTDQ